MALIIRPEAEEDVLEAYTWYASNSRELAERFTQALETCFFELQDNPLAYTVVYKTLRRFLLPKFPYSIFYLVEEGLLEDGGDERDGCGVCLFSCQG
jgi:plasmid stabilization system protein ParE